MKKINYEIETLEEKRMLTSVQMKDIIERYKESNQVKKLTKQKRNNQNNILIFYSCIII